MVGEGLVALLYQKQLLENYFSLLVLTSLNMFFKRIIGKQNIITVWGMKYRVLVWLVKY